MASLMIVGPTHDGVGGVSNDNTCYIHMFMMMVFMILAMMI